MKTTNGMELKIVKIFLPHSYFELKYYDNIIIEAPIIAEWTITQELVHVLVEYKKWGARIFLPNFYQ